MNAQVISAVFAIALAIMGLGTAVVIGLRGAALKADLKQVRESNDDLRKEIADKERHTVEQDARIHDLERDYAELKEADARKDVALARIGEQALSRAEIKELVTTLREHDREAASRHAATIRALREIRDAQAARIEEGDPE